MQFPKKRLEVDAATSNGMVCVGPGYTFLRIGKPNNKLYAFSLEGDSAQVMK